MTSTLLLRLAIHLGKHWKDVCQTAGSKLFLKNYFVNTRFLTIQKCVCVLMLGEQKGGWVRTRFLRS